MPWANEEKEDHTDHTMCEQTQTRAPLLCKDTSLWPITQSPTWSTGQETVIRTNQSKRLPGDGRECLLQNKPARTPDR